MRLGHVHLKVRELERSEDFYKKVLGARESERLNNRFVFLSTGSAHHDVALQALGSGAPDPEAHSVGLYHTAFEVADVQEMLVALQVLESMSVPYQLVDHGISWAAYLEDPDGNGVELYLDRRERGGTLLWNGQSKRLRYQELVESKLRKD